MKSLYDSEAAQEITSRFATLRPDSEALWGRMSAPQMVAHCVLGAQMALGDITPKRLLLGRLIGPLFRAAMWNDKPWGKGTPTAPELVTSGEYDLESERLRLVAFVERFQKGGPAGATKDPHCFFGQITPEQWGKGLYKHLDHHLRQFGT